LNKTDESNILLNVLLETYFPESKINFNNSNNNPLKTYLEIENQILNEPSISYKKIIKDLIANKSEEEIYIRGGVFKREIPKIYNYTCCISEMRIVSTLDISMVDACHIKPFSVSYDDTICNGIPLSPNLHRAFDRGLIAIDENYKVVISKVFTENMNHFSLNQFSGKRIFLPENKKHYPDSNNFNWHGKNVFKS
jgi:putative restriction endonuclease